MQLINISYRDLNSPINIYFTLITVKNISDEGYFIYNHSLQKGYLIIRDN